MREYSEQYKEVDTPKNPHRPDGNIIPPRSDTKYGWVVSEPTRFGD